MDARKVRFGPQDALSLLAGIDRLVAVRGKSEAAFDLAADRPADDALLAHLMGPTGNLRAPTARVGRTLVVGFSDAVYRREFGG